jgi:peptide/nickel transport system permease protein
MLPVVTSVGLLIGQSVGGAVVIEILFGINGIGKMMVDAVRQQDVPTIMGGVLIAAVVIAVVNLLTDLSYALIDPRLETMYGQART